MEQELNAESSSINEIINTTTDDMMFRNNKDDPNNVLVQKEIENEVRKEKSQQSYSFLLYSFLLSGPLTWKKETVLQDVRSILKISLDYHKKELNRIEK